MFPRRFSSCLQATSPLVVGLFIGVILSLITAPFIDEKCESSRSLGLGGKSPGMAEDDPSVNPNSKPGPVDYASPDFEPYYVTNKPAVPKSKFKSKFVRPKYASIEMGIKDKLLICIISSTDTIDKVAVGLNKTLTHRIGDRSKVIFFIGPKTGNLPSGMTVVSFPSSSPQQIPFHAMKYALDHYQTKYSWFLFVPDTTYIRPLKMFDFINQISISYNLYMGAPVDYTYQGHQFCNFNSGVLLSNIILQRVVGDLPWCLGEASTDDSTLNIGRCVSHAANMSCITAVRSLQFTSHDLRGTTADLALTERAQLEGMHNALTVHSLKNATDIYKLHRHMCEWEVRETKVEMEDIKKEIERLSVFAPGGRQSLVWPIGVEAPYKAQNRYDIIRWDYFTPNLVYMQDDFNVASPMSGIDKDDVADILNRSREAINQTYPGVYNYDGYINGYKRFDPTRGMEYIFDFRLIDKISGEIIGKRAEIVRPLGSVEIVPMPYVTENSKVHLVLTITHDNMQEFASFMELYETVCLIAKANVHLFIVFVYNPGEITTGREDAYALLKSVIAVYETKYDTAAKLTWMNLQADRAIPFAVMDLVLTKVALNSLMLSVTPQSEFSADFLKRVRMNTIVGKQVFFPIAFYQYKPNLVYEKRPYPHRVELAIKRGHFDVNSFEHCAFYLSDYRLAKSKTKLADLYRIDFYDMFLKYHTVQTFRASEPNLRHRFKLWQCAPSMEPTAYLRCLESKASGLASSAQLAMLIFETQLSGILQ